MRDEIRAALTEIEGVLAAAPQQEPKKRAKAMLA